jgi:hypothetical protein
LVEGPRGPRRGGFGTPPTPDPTGPEGGLAEPVFSSSFTHESVDHIGRLTLSTWTSYLPETFEIVVGDRAIFPVLSSLIYRYREVRK